MLKFEKNHYTIEEVTLCGETVRFRAFRDLVYVEKTGQCGVSENESLCAGELL